MDKTWFQNYDPLKNAVLSTILAALPILVLLGSLALLRIKIHFAALAGLGFAILIALFVYKMPVSATVATSLFGGAYGLFPIGWIILNLNFLGAENKKLYGFLYSRFGVKKQELSFQTSGPKAQLNLGDLERGVYVLWLTDGNTVFSGKLIAVD